jgi:hypothetical protein
MVMHLVLVSLLKPAGICKIPISCCKIALERFLTLNGVILEIPDVLGVKILQRFESGNVSVEKIEFYQLLNPCRILVQVVP